MKVPELPREGSFVLCADYESRVGKVLELYPSMEKPGIVRVWIPKQSIRGREDLSLSR